jgi:hypothetical protein
MELHYRQPIAKNRINMGFGTYPELSLAQFGVHPGYTRDRKINVQENEY